MTALEIQGFNTVYVSSFFFFFFWGGGGGEDRYKYINEHINKVNIKLRTPKLIKRKTSDACTVTPLLVFYIIHAPRFQKVTLRHIIWL